jgi:hypothetical protein
MLNGRSPNLPLPLYEYEIAKQKGFAHIDLLPKVKGYVSSFIPPTSIFNNPKNPERAAKYAAMTLKLWPLILRRISLACVDSDVRPLKASDWRQVLGGEYFQNQWPAEERKDFKAAPDFWRHGGALFFGNEDSRKILGAHLGTHPPFTPTFGTLLCGHEPTLERVQKNPTIIPMVVYGVAHWDRLLQFALLAPEAMANIEIPGFDDGPRGVTRVPDFFGTHRTRNDGAIALIKQVVLGNLGEDAIPAHGWLRPFSGLEGSTKEKREWIKAARTYFLQRAAHRHDFDTPNMTEGWMGRAMLLDAHIQSLQDDKLDPIAQELVNRCFVTAMLAGQWPVEMLVAPERGLEHLQCQECGGEVAKLTAEDWDLSDEGE